MSPDLLEDAPQHLAQVHEGDSPWMETVEVAEQSLGSKDGFDLASRIIAIPEVLVHKESVIDVLVGPRHRVHAQCIAHEVHLWVSTLGRTRVASNLNEGGSGLLVDAHLAG